MNDLKSTIDETIETLKQERDELRVQAHLAKAELKDEWEDIEERLKKLYAKRDELADAASEVAEDVRTAAGLLVDEIKAGFERLRKHLP